MARRARVLPQPGGQLSAKPFYPTHPRADYAQLQLARSYTNQMLAPERDQQATKDAIKEIEIFLQRFPNSKLLPEARKMEREAKDRLSEANYRVGFFYYRIKWYTGAVDRFKEILVSDPQYTNRVALYFHPAESLYLQGKQSTVDSESQAKFAEALPYYERLVTEFEKSEYLAGAQKRISELKNPS